MPSFKSSYTYAEVAHLVEHDLAKVGVASSSLVFRSFLKKLFVISYLLLIAMTVIK